MAPIARYPAGVPCWIDTEQPDPEAARHFYSRLLQWTAREIVPEGAGGHYFVAELDELAVAGIASGGDERARWNTYFAVDELERGLQAVTDADGTVVAGPVDGGETGRAASCVDPTGARFGLWEARRHAGAEVVRVPGAWDVSDLHTDDPITATRFYEAVFGWEAGSVEVGAGESVTALHAAGETIGWVAGVEPEDDGPCWHVTFTVAARDDAASAAQQLGAEVLSELDSRWSRAAVVRDPQGAMFSLSQALRGD